MSKFILIVERDDDKVVRYFGPFDTSGDALKAGENFFYEKTPYFVSVIGLATPDSIKDCIEPKS